jgi:hypothetical protein
MGAERFSLTTTQFTNPEINNGRKNLRIVIKGNSYQPSVNHNNLIT